MTKKYGREKYNLGRIRTKKTQAKKVAKSYREDGYKARVGPKTKKGYGIYVKKRK